MTLGPGEGGEGGGGGGARITACFLLTISPVAGVQWCHISSAGSTSKHRKEGTGKEGGREIESQGEGRVRGSEAKLSGW